MGVLNAKQNNDLLTNQKEKKYAINNIDPKMINIYIEKKDQKKEIYRKSYEGYDDKNNLSDMITESYFKSEIEIYKDKVHFEEKYGYEIFRRFVDIAFCLVALVPTIIIIFIFSLIIIIESPGIPFFSQIRVGKNGKLLKIYKLRSMKSNINYNKRGWTEKNDPRITKVGKLIRKYRIDELPQLLNVLSGKMSLIGPRPEIPILTKKFNLENPGFVTRLMVTPGLSGWAQVNGGYELNPREKWELDMIYIEKRSIRMYVKIFFLTIKTVLTGTGSR